MTKIKQFFKTLWKLFTDISFYHAAGAQEYRPILTFVFSFTFLYMAITAASVFSLVFLLIPSKTLDKALEVYPADLVVKVESGHASINQPEPYVIPFPADAADTQNAATPQPKNVIVFDTQSPFDATTFDSYSTFVLVKKDFVVMQDRGALKIIPFKEGADNFTISKDILAGWIAKARPYVVPVVLFFCVFLFIFMTFFGGIIFGAFLLAEALLPALVAMVVSKLTKHQLNYTQAFKIAIYATIPLQLVSTALSLATLGEIPYLATALVITLIVLLSANRRHLRHGDADQSPQEA